jgi:hypothetical protein
MNKMSESGFTGCEDDKNKKRNMENVNAYYSENINPENPIFRVILFQTMCWQSLRAATRNPVEALRYE